jgi:hypothetical protein
MDANITGILVYGIGVVGCKRHSREIMIVFQVENDKECHDIFLTQEQAQRLHVELGEKLKANKD